MATDYTIPKEEYRALVAENERLQEQSERLFDKTLELATENARLRELIYDRAHVHAIQHMTEDELRVTATNVMEENRKLRELVRDLYAEWRFAHARMRYIVLQHEERMRGIEQRMSELGLEVSE